MSKRNRFTHAKTRRLELTDGDWIEAKDTLNYGERQHLSGGSMRAVMAKTEDDDAEVQIDYERYALVRIGTWVVGWSFEDQNGNPVRVTRESIAALDEETGDEIDKALTAHIKEMEEAKNPPPTTEPTSG